MSTSVAEDTASRRRKLPRNRSGAAAKRGTIHRLALDRFSGIYIIVLMWIGFSLWLPNTFGTGSNFKIVVQSQAITGIIALAATVCLIAGVFDLSIGATMSVSISIVGVLHAQHGMNPLLAIVISLVVGGVIGCVNALVVTRFHIDPVIGTLAMSSILEAVTYWVANGQTVLYGFSKNFVSWGNKAPLGIPAPVIYLVILAIVAWYLLEQTPSGRYLYAAGANPEAARLSGVDVTRLTWMALISSGILASAAGVVITMQLGTAPFQAGLPYLLPAYAAAFLGSTQVQPGRFNVVGTVVSMFIVAVAVRGLQLRFPSSSWVADLVQGVILLLAVGFAVWARRKRAASG